MRVKIRDHVFRGEKACLYPVTHVTRFGLAESEVCGRPVGEHRESADAVPTPLPHWYLGLWSCAGCGLGFDHVAHYFSPSRLRLVGLR